MLGYRKFIVCLVAMVLCSILVMMGKIGDQVYATVMLASIGAYMGANALTKAKS